MTTIWECDWCKDQYKDRNGIVLADMGFSGQGTVHICHDCLPDHVESELDLQEAAPP